MSAWFYRDANQEVGPFDQAVLCRLKDAGIITGQTPVRASNGEQWSPYETLFPPAASTEPNECLPATGDSPESILQAPSNHSVNEYYYLDEGREAVGPFDIDALERLYSSGQISTTTFVCRKGDEQWTALASVLSIRTTAHPDSPSPSMRVAETSRGASDMPIWPWIACGVCALCWLLSLAYDSSIKHEARPLVREVSRMNSSDYQVGEFLKGMVRGSQGDPFGEASDQYDKASDIQNRLDELSSDYAIAKTSADIWFVLTLASGSAGVWLRNRALTTGFSASLPIWSVKYWWGQ